MRFVRSPGVIRRQVTAYLIAAGVVGLDLITKRWAAIQYADAPETIIPGILTFRFVENPGAAFSMFEEAGPFLGLAAVIAVGIVAASLGKPRPTHEAVAFGLIIGGALGNLIDRIARGPGILDGKVIDWIDLRPIPTFNVADSAITVAVAILIIGSWKKD
ncbi:MAG TPA: signal peptidase II [Acidimicrobiia bacterium]|nr:signal peptidase II [Acidimicrobiia bacterium]